MDKSQENSVAKLLNFIDHLCIDEQLYWRVPLVDGSGDTEVRWHRDLFAAAWTIGLENKEVTRSVTTRDLMGTLRDRGVDVEHFERQLGASILTQAVFADMVREGAVEIFGEAVVARSVGDTRAFLKGVADTAAELTAPKEASAEKQALRLVRK